MKTKDRILILLSSYFWAIMGLFFTSSFVFFLLPVAAIVYLFIGGKKHA
ncbi:MAG: hypothetical protein KKG64_03020 [Firmicutes bacterium]|nr:hypothetical protein [Bacillota bacterium]